MSWLSKSKRTFITCLTLAVFMFTLAAPVAAAPAPSQLTMEQALDIATKAFDIPAKMVRTNSSFQTNSYMGRSTWQFQWTLPQSDGKAYSINTSLDADTGEILSYWDESAWRERGDNPDQKITTDQAEQIARNFLHKMQPDKVEQVKLLELPVVNDDNVQKLWENPIYNFTFQRQVRGISFPENQINIGVGMYTGKITSYNCNWEDLDFPSLDGVISAEQARQAFEEQQGLTLKYLRPDSPFPGFISPKEVQIYYVPFNIYSGNQYIDAFTGKIVSNQGQEIGIPRPVIIDDNQINDTVTSAAYESDGQTTPATPASNLESQAKLTMQEAQEKAKALVEIPTDYELTNARYNEGWGWNDEKTWQFEYGKNVPGKYLPPINVTIDALTGELQGYWQQENFEVGQEVKYNWEQGKQAVLKFIERVQPDKLNDLTLVSEDPSAKLDPKITGKPIQPVPNFYYRFVRLVNGIPFEQNSISVGFNASNGQINNFNMTWNDEAKFAPVDNLISVKEATDKLLTKASLELAYIRNYQVETTKEAKPEIRLVYRLINSDPKVINAFTGELVNPWQLDNAQFLKDIQGHWASKQIESLATVDVVKGNTAGDFEPDKDITRAEFVKMLVTSRGLKLIKPKQATFSDVQKQDWFYAYVETAAQAGIVQGNGDKFNPDQQISRQEMAVMVMRALQQSTDNMEKLSYTDAAQIAKWAKGSVAKAEELGIMTGNKNLFRPQDKATKAEAAVIIFRILSNHQNISQSNEITVTKQIR